MTEREIKIEDYLTRLVEARGGLCWKLAPVSAVGIPDRLVLLPGGRVGFIELKRPGKVPTKIQAFWIQQLVNRGFAAGWTDNRAGVDELVRRMGA
jgi:hypothetical protein